MEEVKLEIQDMFESETSFDTEKEEVEQLEKVDQEPKQVEEPDEEIKEVEEVEEVEELEEAEENLDLNSPKSVYTVLKDFIPLEDREDVDEDFLRQELEDMPSRLFMNYVDSRPDEVKELLQYQANLDGNVMEKLTSFFNKYVAPIEIPNIESTEGAKEYLKGRPEIVKLYKTEEKINQALDMWEDDEELLSKAKEFYEEDSIKREADKKAELRRVEDEKKAKLEAQKQFAFSIQTEAEKLTWEKERKEKALKQINSDNISNKWNTISTTPLHLIQFGNLLDYYNKDTGFQELYDVLEGKNKSQEALNKKKTIARDSLGKILKTNNPERDKKSIESFFS